MVKVSYSARSTVGRCGGQSRDSTVVRAEVNWNFGIFLIFPFPFPRHGIILLLLLTTGALKLPNLTS